MSEQDRYVVNISQYVQAATTHVKRLEAENAALRENIREEQAFAARTVESAQHAWRRSEQADTDAAALREALQAATARAEQLEAELQAARRVVEAAREVWDAGEGGLYDDDQWDAMAEIIDALNAYDALSAPAAEACCPGGGDSGDCQCSERSSE